MEFTDSDIKRVEEIFFRGNGSFQDEKGERYAFISCIDTSLDVEACPGSGKTTSLLAKLYLLSESMPLENGKGICVLTHTNVAIAEIKRRLGNKADRLFRYPNFFGTIQSFVDKYLAIPFYANKYFKRPTSIDTQLAATRLLRSFLGHEDWPNVRKVRGFLYANGELPYQLTFKRSEERKYELVKNLGGDKIKLRKPRSKTDWSSGEKAVLYKTLFRLRQRVFGDSAVISYDDAYFLAQEYLLDYPRIKQAVSSRFSHLFIDEMQDTYPHQDNIIKEVFDKHIVIQRIGDPNQAILNDNSSESAWEDSERFKITGSRRFSQPIANVLRTVALKGDPGLTGTGAATIPPHIISYKAGQEHQVLEKFLSLIHELGLDGSTPLQYPFKAVGWVGKEKEGLTIGSYFPSFSKVLVKKKSLNTLKSALLLCEAIHPKEFYNTVIDCCLEILRLSGIKHDTSKGQRFYNKTSFLKLLQRHHPQSLIALNGTIATLGRKLIICKPDEVLPEMRSYLKDTFFPAINFTLNKSANTFIDSDEIAEVTEEQIESKNTFYSEKEHLKHIPVEVGTVHSVKGETHKATLYLETFYRGKTCGEYLIDQLLGKPYNAPKNKKDTYKKACLKIAHVGMSRPTHLLCVAINQNLVDQKRRQFEKAGWTIVQ